MLKCDTICCNNTAERKDQLKITSCNNVQLNGHLGCLRAGLKQHRLLGAKAFHCSVFDSVPHPSEGDKLNSVRFTVMTFQNNEFVCSVQKLKLLVIAEFLSQTAENPVALLEDQVPFRIACV